MEWLTAVKGAIRYMEDNLLTVENPEEVAASVCISTMYLQRGFQILTGFTLGEYIRNRRLYLAALDITGTDIKMIDAAFKYGYETPESFTKAFTRFHGASPSDVRRGSAAMKTFLPLRINIVIQGGNGMEHKIKKIPAFKVIGFQKEFAHESAYKEIPEFWDEICGRYFGSMNAGRAPENEYEKAVADYNIGEYGVCVDDLGCGRFRYIIAGKYTGGEVPEGMTVFEFPQLEWAVFDCVGPMPDSLQSLNTQIFREWLPGNSEYELSGNFNIEWYSPMDGSADNSNYHSAIWLPVKRR